MVREFDTAKTVLSPLESKILEVLWQKGPSKVRDIYGVVKDQQDCAQTSIAVTLDRLCGRGMVSRKTVTGRGGLAYIYSANASKADFEKSVVQKAVDRVIDRFGDAAISYFNEKYQ